MMLARSSFLVAVIFFTGLSLGTREAHADPASVTVGSDWNGRWGIVRTPGRFARPPDPEPVPVAVPYVIEPDRPRYEREIYRSPFRLQLGPTAVTTGRGLGMGLGVAADFGTGTVGARIAASWMRGERSSEIDAQTSALGTGLAQYTGELTLDLIKRGPVHPVIGVGFGVAHVSKPGASGNAGIGIARIAIEYSLGLEDADVRLGGGLTGALAGPSDREVADLGAYAIVGANVAIGF